MGYKGVPFYPQRQDLLDPRGGIWSREAGDYSYRIKHWEPAGDTALVLETQRLPVPISPAERDSVIEGVRLQLQERGDARQDWSKVPETRAHRTSVEVLAVNKISFELRKMRKRMGNSRPPNQGCDKPLGSWERILHLLARILQISLPKNGVCSVPELPSTSFWTSSS